MEKHRKELAPRVVSARLTALLDLVDDVAARMWRAEAEDSGTPASVLAGRTRAAFDEQAPELKARWRKFARAAVLEVIGL